ncbi:MAG: YHS domain-containing protein [Candidatus Geothermarchaeales archaeon]
MVEDPVCGMEVDEKSAIYKSEYKGRTYYSCSVHCKWEFDPKPQDLCGLHPYQHKT